MSTLVDELGEKMEEARGKLSNLIFGKKGKKKPKELVQTIHLYLVALTTRQQQQQQQQLLQQQQQQQQAQQSGGAATISDGSSGPGGTGVDGVAPTAIVNAVSPSAAMEPLITPNTVAAINESDLSITSELDQVCTILYGDTGAEASTSKEPDPKVAREVVDLMFEYDLFRRLLDQIKWLEFEARKYFTRAFEYALTQRREAAIPYVLQRRRMVLQCILGYEDKEVSIATSCDAILRACIQCEPIAEMILQSAHGAPVPSSPTTQGRNIAAATPAATATATTPTSETTSDAPPPGSSTNSPSSASASSSQQQPSSSSNSPTSTTTSTSNTNNTAATTTANSPNSTPNLLDPFFRALALPTFINSHAFASFKLLLTLHPQLGANFLKDNYDYFFWHYNRLLQSENYLTKVQAFSFLGELLMERLNQEVMMRYVNDPDHLKLSMLALRGPKAIQLAVFNVLKIFVPNPYKADSITRILTANKKTFLAFLEEFERESEDELLVAHKAEMTHALLALPDVNVTSGKRSVGSAEEAVQQRMQMQQQQQQQQQQAMQPQISQQHQQSQQ